MCVCDCTVSVHLRSADGWFSETAHKLIKTGAVTQTNEQDPLTHFFLERTGSSLRPHSTNDNESKRTKASRKLSKQAFNKYVKHIINNVNQPKQQAE